MNYSRENRLVQTRVPLQMTERNRVARPADYSTHCEFSLSELNTVHSAATTFTAANLHREITGELGLFIDRCSPRKCRLKRIHVTAGTSTISRQL